MHADEQHRQNEQYGSIDRAQFSNESIDWQAVERARDVIADAAANVFATRTERST